MLKKIIFLLIILIYAGGLQAQLNIEWQKCFGGTKVDAVKDVLQTSDGGFIMNIYTKSNDGDFTENLGGKDICLLKLDRFGKKQWQKSYGGTKDDYLNYLLQTSDGGYIFSANNGTVVGNSNNENDWIVKINASGSILWQKFFDYCNEIVETPDKGYIVSVVIDTTIVKNNITSYSGIPKIMKINQNGEIEWQKNIEGSKIIKTTDGNYFICSESNWPEVGDIRYWKINQQGDILWEKKIGGSADDFARDVQQTSDGGYILTGITLSNDGDVSGNHGQSDAWLVKLNSNGEIQWQKCIGGTGYEESYLKVVQIKDGGYLVSADYTYSSNGNFIGSHGESSDIWISKLNDLGVTLWEKCIGGSGSDFLSTFITASDGGFLLYGGTNSNDGDVINFKGGDYFDIWIVKINSIGNIEWQRCYGGSNMEYAELKYGLFKTSEEDFFIINTMSNDNDVSGNHGDYDVWVVKLTSKSITNSLTEISNSNEKLTVYPNPLNNKFSIQFNEPIFKITLMDMLGNLVYTNDSGNKEYYIPENLHSGSYMLEIETPKGRLHENIFINKN
jgi:hypothetical protein